MIQERSKLGTSLLLFAAILTTRTPAQFSLFETLAGDDQVGVLAGEQMRPASASGAGVTLVVWEDGGGSLIDTVFGQQALGSNIPEDADVHGMLVDQAGAPLLQAPIVIASDTFVQKNLCVAFNGTDFLVTFQTTRLNGTLRTDGIEAVRVTPSGQIRDLDPIVVYDTPGQLEWYPAAAGMGGDWLVVWQGWHPTNGNSIVEGRVVHGDGSMEPRRQMMSANAVSATHLSVAAAGSQGRYCVVAEHLYGQRVVGRVFDATGASVGGAFTIDATGGRRPGVASDGQSFFAAWGRGGAGVEGTLIDANGIVATPDGTALAPLSLGAYDDLAMAWDGARYTIAYSETPEIRSLRVDATGQVTFGPAVVDTSPRRAVDSAVAGINGQAMIAWSDWRFTPNGFGVDQEDVLGLTLDDTGVIDDTAPISIGPPAQFRTRIAGDPEHGFLAVYNSWYAGTTRIVARAIDANGTALAPEPFVIVETPDRIIDRPDVAWNGSEFFVVWQRLRSMTPAGTPPLIEGRRVRLDGTWLDASPIPLMTGVTPGVDAVGGTFLAAAQYHHPVLQSNGIVHAVRVEGSTGSVLDATPIVLDGAGGWVDVVGLLDRWVVAFGGIRTVLVSAAGVPSPAVYSADTGSSGGNRYVRLAASPSGMQALLTYEARDAGGVIVSGDIRMRRFELDGTSMDSFLGPAVTISNNAQLRGAGAFVGDEMVFGWADHRSQAHVEPGIGDVYFGRMDLDATRKDGAGFPLLVTPLPEGSVEVLGFKGARALLAASSIDRTGSTSGVHRVRFATYRGGPIGQPSCAQALPNSSGQLGQLAVRGTGEVGAGDLVLDAFALPPLSFGYFLVAPTQGLVTMPGGSLGNLCLGASVGRYVGPGQTLNSSTSGSFTLAVDPRVTPQPTGTVAIPAGSTWYFQAWHRDSFGGVPGSHFTGSVGVSFR